MSVLYSGCDGKSDLSRESRWTRRVSNSAVARVLTATGVTIPASPPQLCTATPWREGGSSRLIVFISMLIITYSSLDFSPRVLEGRGFRACGKNRWYCRDQRHPCSEPPRRPARHPSSSEEGSILGNSPPDSGGVARRAPGWLSAPGRFSAACKAPPFQNRGEKSGLVHRVIR